MELRHSGKVIDCTVNPIEGCELALNASNGADSKKMAWQWADDAVEALKHYSLEKGLELEAILNNTTTNFPNVLAGLEFVDSL